MMNKYIFTLLLSFCSLFANGQEESLHQLISYLEQPTKKVTDTLVAKGWTIDAALSAEKDNELYQTFSFGNLQSDKKQALAWLRIHASHQVVGQVYYQLSGREAFFKLMSEMDKIVTEKKEMQNIENKQINTYYESDRHLIQTIVGGGSYTLMLKLKNN